MLAGAAGHGRCTYRGYSRFPLSSTPSPSLPGRKRTRFVDSQRYGIDVFRAIPQDVQSSSRRQCGSTAIMFLGGLYHTMDLSSLWQHWSGEWPGLVGMLNLNACLTKAGIRYDTLWSADFRDEYFPFAPPKLAPGRSRPTRRVPCEGPGRAASVWPAANRRPRRRRGVNQQQGDSRTSSTKAAWGCTTQSSRRTPSSHGNFQGAIESVGSVRRDEAGVPGWKRKACATGSTERE